MLDAQLASGQALQFQEEQAQDTSKKQNDFSKRI
jgi:hypothetical protein